MNKDKEAPTPIVAVQRTNNEPNVENSFAPIFKTRIMKDGKFIKGKLILEDTTNKEVVIRYIKEETKFDGIISTKPQVVKLAKKYDLVGVQRVFVFDTLSLNTVKNHMISECDAIEVLPGIIPKVLGIISKHSNKPVVAGGLIETKEEVMQALSSGATCISTTKKEIWEM